MLLLTMGNAAGIGPEIITRAFAESPADMELCVVVGDLATMRRASALVAEHPRAGQSSGPAWPIALLGDASEEAKLPPRCIGLLQKCELSVPVPYGLVSAFAGEAAAQCIAWAARAVLGGEAAGMVTAPIHKEALAACPRWAGFPGHTELLQAEAAHFLGLPIGAVPVRMMLANHELKVVLVSIHLSLRTAIEALSQDAVLQTVRITHNALRASLGRVPRIAVAGLNPHAGEGGLFGTEEKLVILPALDAARAEGIDVHGPFAPDTVFMRARHSASKPGEFDVVVAMYHDQGLIPVKYLGAEHGVNVTLGLPLLRTSPDHGTAFDIAGRGVADPSSMLAAVRMARALVGPAVSASVGR
ncbi:MAG: 4-hydroxythreonine-4-phosphate dehydrogenase PdxA [Polaromonas sp.]|nr:4-hydroxythreonine-4-phosphate dehydrogenase PdxA [Polaromonas sp.]